MTNTVTFVQVGSDAIFVFILATTLEDLSINWMFRTKTAGRQLLTCHPCSVTASGEGQWLNMFASAGVGEPGPFSNSLHYCWITTTGKLERKWCWEFVFIITLLLFLMLFKLYWIFYVIQWEHNILDWVFQWFNTVVYKWK